MYRNVEGKLAGREWETATYRINVDVAVNVVLDLLRESEILRGSEVEIGRETEFFIWKSSHTHPWLSTSPLYTAQKKQRKIAKWINLTFIFKG